MSFRPVRFALLFIVILGMSASAKAQEKPVRLAMLPIVVHSADDPVFLREGLADMLTARLDQAGGFEIIHVGDLELATTRLDEALEAGKDANAEFVLFGSFTRFGTGASLDMQCASTSVGSGKPPLREIFVHSGSIGEVIPDLNDLVGKLSRFAITGYSETQQSQASADTGEVEVEDEAGQATLQEIEDLSLRIQSLEASLEELSAVVYEDQPSEVDEAAVEVDVEVDEVDVDQAEVPESGEFQAD